MYKVISHWDGYKKKDLHEFHEDALKEAHEKASKDHYEDRTWYVMEIHDVIQNERQPLPTVGVKVNVETAKALFGESDGDATTLQIED